MYQYSVKRFITQSGERYCLLVNPETGLPFFYSNLYVTTQIRNNSKSYSSMEAALGSISVLLKYFDERGEDIEKRFKEKNFLKPYELDAIRDHCQTRFSKNKEKNNRVVSFLSTNKKTDRVSNDTVYSRLTNIAKYLNWLAKELSPSGCSGFILEMTRGIKTRRPQKKNRNVNSKEELEGLNKEEVDTLFELFDIDSEFNPFKDKSVRVRNHLMFYLLFYTGMRRGELLNIRVRDIDFVKNQLVIPRRADEKDDVRLNQPKVKTLDRRIPLKDTLIAKVHSYILNERRVNQYVKRHDYLFVTHKSGKYLGYPTSISTYEKMFNTVRNSNPLLYRVHGHQLRHTWNERFSDLMDSKENPPSQAQQEKDRSYLMGWGNEESAKHYNKRFVKKKAFEASLGLQNSSMPKSSSISLSSFEVVKNED